MLIMTAPTILFLAVLATATVRALPQHVTPPKPTPLSTLVPTAFEIASQSPASAFVPVVPDAKGSSGAAVPRTTFVAVGDIMLSRSVGAVIRQKNDVKYPYAATADFTRGVDIAFANLETAVTPGRAIAPGEMTFRADPDTVKGLADAGFDVVSLANNHVPNFGQKGLTDTFKHLHDAGIAYAGAGEDAAVAHAPAIIERNGLRFAFLAYNDHDVVPASYAAADKHAGTAFMDADAMTVAVKAARANADVVIVSMHSGHEYAFVPDKSQIDFAHAAIDAGADAVIGHHAHVVQSVEYYKGKAIFYGLGNFIFDQDWSVPTREGLVIKVTFAGTKVVGLEAFPVQILHGSQPNFSSDAAADETLARLGVPVQKVGDGYQLVLPEAPAP